jgi:cardiolipin synthase
MRGIRQALLVAAFLAPLGLAQFAGADQGAKSRDILALPGEQVEAVALFVGSVSQPVQVRLAGALLGTAPTDGSGLVHYTLNAPRTPGFYALSFTLGSTSASATLQVLDPSKPPVVIEASVLGRPDAAQALAQLASGHEIVYLAPDSSSVPAGLPQGATARIKAGGLSSWLQALSARGINPAGGIVGSSGSALALQSAGFPGVVAGPSLSAAVGTLQAGNAAWTAPNDLSGDWEVLDAGGMDGGILNFSGPGPWVASRSGSLIGQATLNGNQLAIAYNPSLSGGISGSMVPGAGPTGWVLEAVYVRDPVEDAFYGTHEGIPESLHRSTAGNNVELLVDGVEMLPAYLAAIKSAQRSIHIESYIWADDSSGNAVTDALCERAKAGVAVRAIMDGVGSKKAKPLAQRLQASGARVLVYNPVSLSNVGAFLSFAGDFLATLNGQGSARDPQSTSGIDHRNHRKTLVIDGTTGFVGGIGFSDDDVNTWHDLHARVTGPVVGAIQRHFEESWLAGGLTLDEDPAVVYPRINQAGTSSVSVLTTAPAIRAEVKRAYLARIDGARSEVLIENPYFTDDDVVAAVGRKAQSGVPTILILPVDGKNDVASVAGIHALERPNLYAAGVMIYDYPIMSHGKVAVIDQTWSTIGSCNLDNRSLERDLELNVASNDPKLAADMRDRIFGVDLKVAQRWTPASEHIGIMATAMGALANAFRDWM